MQMALRSTPHQSLASSKRESMTWSPHKWITSGADRHGRLASSSWETMQYFVYLPVISYIVTQGNLRFITYSREELLDIRSTSTHNHYDQEYDFPEADPLFSPPPRTMDGIPAGEPKQRRRKRGRRSCFLVRLRRRAHRALLQSILFTNVQSLDHKVAEIQARIAFQRDTRD
jgi:hypothetical protein